MQTIYIRNFWMSHNRKEGFLNDNLVHLKDMHNKTNHSDAYFKNIKNHLRLWFVF